MTRKQIKAVRAWKQWYADRLDRISEQLAKGEPNEDYSGYEQDLFNAFHEQDLKEAEASSVTQEDVQDAF